VRRGGDGDAVIEDDGRGFDPAATREGGFGLARDARARRRCSTAADDRVGGGEAGTTIVAEVPLRDPCAS
jgi:signal transduction histidine kinase